MAGFRSIGRARILQVASSLVVLLGLAAGFAPSVKAAGPSLNVVGVSTVNYPTIKVTVEALGSNGLPVTGLDRGAFSVSENGQQQTVVSAFPLQTSTRPLDVMLVMDTSLSMRDNGKLRQAQDAATAFVAQMRPIDHVGLIQFDSQLTVVSPFTTDRGTLTKKIGGLTAQGNTRLYDALVLALTQAAITGSESRAIVLVTDGQDTESASGLSQVLGLIHASGFPVFTIGIGGDVDDRVLGQLAQASGGHYFRAPSAADIGTAFKLMSNQLRNRYELDYSSPATAPKGSTIDLRVTAQTPQGLASGQSSYVMPAFTGQPRPTAAVSGQPQAVRAAFAALSLPSEYAAGGLAMLGVLLAAGGLALAEAQKTRHARLAFFVAGAGGGGGAAAGGEIATGPSLLSALVVPLLGLLARLITRLLPPAQVQRTSRQLALAGNPFGWRVTHFVVARCVVGAGAAILTGFLVLGAGQPLRGMLLIAVFGFLGYRLPVFWLKRRIKRRQNSILRTLPDALDLLTVCVEAGLGLDGAMLEVVNKWDNALSDEFAIVLAELKMGRGRREALRGLAERTGVEEVKVFTSAMVQADELGMGIARPLTLQAEQLRLKRRQFAERKAREAGIKMVVTMGLLIMPALFLIIVSPAVVQIGKVFKLH